MSLRSLMRLDYCYAFGVVGIIMMLVCSCHLLFVEVCSDTFATKNCSSAGSRVVLRFLLPQLVLVDTARHDASA